MLNAKFHQKEADIVAEAGIAGTVTIATNMAGRGTDIKLGKVSRKPVDWPLSVLKGMNQGGLTGS